MATQVQNRRGSTAEHSTFTGAVGELTVDTDKDTVVVHDGSTAGGAPLLREDGSNSALALGSAASPSLKFTGDTNTGIYSPGADQVAISSNSSERIRIGANGEIGIGGANYGTSGQVLTSGGSGAAPSWTTLTVNTDKIEEGNSSAEVIDTGSDGRFVVTTEGSERLRIDSSGRLGLGTSSPVNTLHVLNETSSGAYINYDGQSNTEYGLRIESNASGGNFESDFAVGSTALLDLYANSTSTTGGDFLVCRTKSATPVLLVKGNGNVGIGDDAPGSTLTVKGATGVTPLQISGPSSEFMRCDSDGRVLVGTTTASVNTLFQVTQATDINWSANLEHTTSGTTPLGIRIKYTASSPNNAGAVFLSAADSTATRAEIRSNGGLANYSSNNVNLSDINAKKDVATAAGTWDCLKEWEIVNFRYKDQPDDADLNMGVIAQQVAENCPEVVTVFQEATEDQPEKLGVKDQQMMWMAIKALQEAQLRIEILEAEVAALKGA